MMDTIEAILTRRSIRAFTSEDIDDSELDTILKAGMAAPSAYNRQPWHFVVVRSREMLSRLQQQDPDAPMAGGAAAGIVVCGDTKLEEVEEFIHVNCAAVTQNILLAANALGLGAVWCGIIPGEQRIKTYCDLLELPKHIQPISVVYVGYPAEDVEVTDRFIPSRIHLEQW